MLVKCPACGGSREVADSLRGKKGRCKGCQQVFVLDDATHPTGLDASQATLQGPSPSAASRPTPTGMPRQIGRFQIRARVGSGAFGTVYRAFDPEMDREVALKVPLPGTLNSPRAVARFFREARAAAQLSHPHIVPLFDAGDDGTHHYIASAFIDGCTLAQSLRENKLRSYQDAARLVGQLAEALAHAHSQGIVHRDVKSSNVMLDRVGDAHLMDFGLAHRDQDKTKLTTEGTLLGTPAYLAPEQAAGTEGKPLPASDQYSLGVVLYELLTGDVPFRGPSSVVLYNILHQDPPRPRSVRPDTPRDLETICLKAMAREPHQRYADCQQLADDLRHWRNDEPIAGLLPAHERLWRWCRRHPSLAWSLAGVAGCILVLAGILTASSLLVAHQAQQEQSAAQTAERAQQTENRERHRAEQEQQRAQQLSAQAKQQEQEMKRAKQAAQKSKHRAREARLATQAERQKTEKTLREIEAAEGSVQEILVSIQREQEKAESTRREIHKRRQLAEEVRFASLKERLKTLFKTQEGVGIPPGLACTSDGKRLASAGPEHSVWIWDTATRKRHHLLRGHLNAVTQILFASRDKELISASWDGTVAVWDLSHKQPRLVFKEHQAPVWCVALSPDGHTVASAGLEPIIRLWDLRTGQPRGKFRTDAEGITALVFSPDGRQLASGGLDGKALIWDLQTHKALPHALNHQSWVRLLAYSHNGEILTTASSKGVIYLWSVRKVTVLRQVRAHTRPITCLRLAPDGTNLVSVAPDHRTQFWDVTNNKTIATLHYPKDSFLCVTFPSEGKPVYGSAGRFDSWGRAIPEKVQFTLGGNQHHPVVTPRSVTCVGVSPDGKRIVSGNHMNTARVWNAETGKLLFTFKGYRSYVRSVCFSPDGKRIVTGSGSYDSKNQKYRGEVRIWDATTGGGVFTLKGHDYAVSSLAFSADGKWILTGNRRYNRQRSEVKVWNANTGTETLNLKGGVGDVSSLAFSPDGQRIGTGSADGTVKIWDAKNGTLLLTLRGHSQSVLSIRFSPDGTRLVTGTGDSSGRGSGEVAVWDATKGTEVRTLGGHTVPVYSVCFAADGKRIVSAGGGYNRTQKASCGEIKVWDVSEGTELLILRSDFGVYKASISPDGKHIVGGNRGVRVWELNPGAKSFAFE